MAETLLTFAGLGDMGKNMSAALNTPPAKPAADYSEVRRVASQGAGGGAIPSKAHRVADHVQSHNGAPPQGYRGGRKKHKNCSPME